MSDPNSSEQDMARVEKAAKELGVFFDTVQIFCSNHNANPEHQNAGTVTTNSGVGNYYTRYGQVREWLVKQDEYTRIQCRKDNEE